MILEFIKLFGKDLGLEQAGDVIDHLKSIMECFEDQYIKDKDVKNAALDTIIKILEEHKDKTS